MLFYTLLFSFLMAYLRHYAIYSCLILSKDSIKMFPLLFFKVDFNQCPFY